MENLALACPHCNRYKGPNIAGVDPESGQLARLFHPRSDIWTEHFQFERERIIGNTAVARATVQVLAINAAEPLRFRLELLRIGIILA